ncbi:MAG: carboxymuconolactone decarboxylase family protein [Kordiimonadaceae bacterium]|jgi:uncharacterized peroxidase-related enzyme|nr:carboxymuconolactone decarboxylase family protein [Kordiimonadaceae bacterium]MBT6037493.1 carboxymuconolactone decarboxylase family protein [Kordiimonadaceae bacterium]MBT6330884.1 carboxymuconolactone decarboxylase family protein [Kordiimonadaceae bacterium]MBT7582703.1 carboxymuconolactone decarboxylase family protein [Kordiimonadaceae bacterium]
MSMFEIHKEETVATEIKDLFREKVEGQGFVPNIFAVVAESIPALLAYENMSKKFSECPFTAAEKETIEIVTSIENNCKYCVAGHSAFAAMQGVPEEIINALRNGSPIEDPRIEALANFTRKFIRSRGKLSNKDIILFFDAGFTRAQLMDVALGISLKTFTNYISNAVSLPLDAAFQPFAWSGLDQGEDVPFYQNHM